MFIKTKLLTRKSIFIKKK